MTEITTIPTGWPGFLQTDNRRGSGYGYRHNHGISDKDSVFLSSAVTDKAVGDTRLDAVRTDLESRDSIKTAIDAVGDSVLSTSCDVKDKVAESKYDLSNVSLNGFANISDKICDAKYQNLLEAKTNASAVALQNATNTAAITLGQVVGFKDGELSATKNAAAAQLQAQVNAAAISAQLAECCCETKLLFKDQEIREVQRLLDAANQATTNSGIQTILSLLSGGILAAARPLGNSGK
jgi:hypothetical protein